MPKNKKQKTREYLEAALKAAKGLLPAWQYAVIHQAAMPSSGGNASARRRRERAEEQAALEMAKAVFVCDEPNSLEAVRGEGLVGPDGALFVEKYLEPLGLTKSEVLVVFAPTSDQLSELPVPYFTLGKAAREKWGKGSSGSFPHPTAVRRKGDSGEVGRKLKKARTSLDAGSSIGKNDLSSRFELNHEPAAETESSAENLIKSKVSKAVNKKQIVYGVVLDPYQFDLQGDWIPPDEVEQTAHDFMKHSGKIWFDHKGHTTATVVESWIQPYPTSEDRDNAFENKAHRVLKTPFGSDEVHSGAWVIGTELSNELWALYEAGEIEAFSIGGNGMREPAEESDMPDIEFIEVSHDA